ncbi:hypothetical protein [Piscinibacter sp.]|uniref:hypothetical protein n=1 Tax=Piscinibacter sp. TaxID=1903157 RepID=UPI002C0EAECE|nr:hypothetical protein [Albitalea sp.]HUG22348.1 hypothetical protein [Albitalea sp.]
MASHSVQSLPFGAAVPRRTCPPPGRRRRRGLAAALSGAALAIGALTGAVVPADPASHRLPAAERPSSDPPRALPAGSASAVAPSSARSDAELLRLGHLDGDLVIQAHGASRLDAAQRLAALTGSALLEQPQALASTRPLTAQWRGRDIAAAWALVLGNEASHALQCDQSRCRVWITGPVAATPASNADRSTAPAAARSAPLHVPVVAPTPAPAAAADPLDPDPPGLFPAD